ncbi:Transforming growth factor-beta receptor-associated 1 [Brachionus plicatilis]|uniref:Transforming growth factor-beta receptor-associated 1 n=1 Tax=Brachionus plicatilis TaxID=10195 RepID=A0A3M7T7H1_BRAPC|nr:Transforming growth factor-beta receptor-associated 1 [Brachionus plicatilis]
MSSLMKVFDLVPVVQQFDGNLRNSQITCFTYSNTILYVGTIDGYILRYSINKSNYLGENVGFKSELIDSNLVVQKKAISSLTVVTKLQKILCLSDSILYPVNFEDLAPSSTFNILKNKNVSCYCFNEKYIDKNSEISILCVCIRGRTIQIFFIRDEDVTFYKEISLSGYCAQMNEFLLNCPGDLGMFATSDGQTTRPPVAWCPDVVKFQIMAPYVLCLRRDSLVKVYNLNDSKLRQEISSLDTIRLIKFINEENCVLISSFNEIYAFISLGIACQVEQLLDKNLVDDAINLFETSTCTNSTDEFEKQMKNIKLKAGFIEFFENDHFSKSQNFLIEANTDYKLLSEMIFSKNTLTDELCKKYIDHLKNDQKLIKFKNLLIELMIKSKTVTKNEEYTNLLLTLCTELRDDLINSVDFYVTLPIKFCLQSIDILKNAKKYHATALVKQLAGHYEDAFELWKDLIEAKIEDSNFPGFNFFIEQLSKCIEHHVVWNYVHWAMEIDQAKAVEIFTNREIGELNSEHYLVNTKNLKNEKYVTQLIGMHLDKIIELLRIPSEEREPEWDAKVEKEREDFQIILENSSNFKAQPILAKLKEFEDILQLECAILYGKIEEHEKALKVLVYNLEDYVTAMNYCLKHSKDSMKNRKLLFNTLFSIYLSPSYKDKEKLLKPALDLMNSNLIIYFDIPKLLEMIPNNWSLKMTGDFLSSVMHYNLSRKHCKLAEKNLAVTHKVALKTNLYNIQKEQLYIDDDSLCYKCHKQFDSTVIIRLPNGLMLYKKKLTNVLNNL